MENDKLLSFVHYVGKNSDDLYVYELFFCSDPDIAVGHGWKLAPASEHAKKPDYSNYKLLLYSPNKLVCLTYEDSEHYEYTEPFSLSDAKCGIIPLAWELGKGGKFRLILHYGTPDSQIKYFCMEREREGFSVAFPSNA